MNKPPLKRAEIETRLRRDNSFNSSNERLTF